MIIGIDLGTTNSLVAVVENGVPRVLKTQDGRNLLPSVVTYSEGRVVVGDLAKSRKIRDARSTAFSVKRLLGRKLSDLDSIKESLPYEIVEAQASGGQASEVKIKIEGHLMSPIEISASILKELKLSAERELKTKVTEAVITVPAYFNDSQRQATRTAGRLAGLSVLRIVNEPTAAALSYGLDRKKEGLIAVYDLGGGTFDLSLLRLKDGIFEVLATRGDTTLGGDDIDRALVSVFTQEIKEKWDLDLQKDSKLVELKAELIERAERLKIELSQSPQATLKLELEGKPTYERRVTLSEFESWVRPLVEKTMEPCRAALKDAGIEASELSDVVMVGGPTRLAIVQKVAAEIFGQTPNTSVHPDEVVALGAAIQADILSGGNPDLLLLDVVPLSLGIETYGGLMSTLIPRNSRIPSTAREVFTTFVDRQTGVDIHVLQGERERVEENRSLAKFKLKGITPQPAGIPRVEVLFLIDADGILQVAAKDLKTGLEQSIEVKPSFGLDEKEIEQMLEKGLSERESDQAYRKLIEAKNEAEPILRATEKSMAQAFNLLPESEARRIESEVKALREALSLSDGDVIRKKTYELSRLTERLAELLVKEAGGFGLK